MSGSIPATLADELATLKRAVAVLSIARKLDDHIVGFVAATRASATCHQLSRRVTDRVIVDSDLAMTIDVAIAETRALIEPHPRCVLAADCGRMIRWMDASEYFDCGDPDLLEVDAHDQDLRSLDRSRLKIAASRFASASLRDSVLDHAWFEECDPSRSDLQRASLRGAALVRGSLNGSSLVDGASMATVLASERHETFQHSGDRRLELRDNQRPGRELLLDGQVQTRAEHAREARRPGCLGGGDRRRLRSRPSSLALEYRVVIA